MPGATSVGPEQCACHSMSRALALRGSAFHPGPQLLELGGELIELVIGHLLETYEAGAGGFESAKKLIQLQNDRIVDYKIRIPEQKQKAVAALKLLNYRVISAGDSFNDTAMLAEADIGFLFHAPANTTTYQPRQ